MECCRRVLVFFGKGGEKERKKGRKEESRDILEIILETVRKQFSKQYLAKPRVIWDFFQELQDRGRRTHKHARCGQTGPGWEFPRMSGNNSRNCTLRARPGFSFVNIFQELLDARKSRFGQTGTDDTLE